MAETGRYVYAVCRNLDPGSLAQVAGLSGGRLETVEHRGLTAVVSTVDLGEYGEEGLRANLENLAWLEQAARGHDTVIQAIAQVAPVAPLRLATICLDDDGVRRRLTEWHAPLEQILDRVEGRSEWSVKVFTDARAATAAKPPESVAGGGAAYLQRKKAETQARATGEAAALAAAEHIHQVLAGAALADRRLPAQDPRLTGHEGTMVHNGAYLVETDGGEAFLAHVDALVADHPDVTIGVRGPWPPYSFAMLEQH